MLRAWTGREQKSRIMREDERRRANFNVWDETIVECSREITDISPMVLLKGTDYFIEREWGDEKEGNVQCL